MQELLREMEFLAERRKIPIIRASERDLFCSLVAERSPRRILEIGTAIGFSTLLIAANAAAGAEVITLEIDSERARLAELYIKRSPYASNITIVNRDAGEALIELTGEYDFIFLDAAKGQYINYLPIIKRHLAKDGVLLADNILFRGYTFGAEEPPKRYRTIVRRLREYWQAVNRDGWTSELLDCGDGMVLSWGKIDDR